jgi:hypothetical protein
MSLRGLRPNDFSCGFIFIEMAKIVVGSPRITQPLLYPGLRPAMLDNIGGVFNVTENQFELMPGRSTMKAIFLIRQLMGKVGSKRKTCI